MSLKCVVVLRPHLLVIGKLLTPGLKRGMNTFVCIYNPCTFHRNFLLGRGIIWCIAINGNFPLPQSDTPERFGVYIYINDVLLIWV